MRVGASHPSSADATPAAPSPAPSQVSQASQATTAISDTDASTIANRFGTARSGFDEYGVRPLRSCPERVDARHEKGRLACSALDDDWCHRFRAGGDILGDGFRHAGGRQHALNPRFQGSNEEERMREEMMASMAFLEGL
jgi:hypothetical protein